MGSVFLITVLWISGTLWSSPQETAPPASSQDLPYSQSWATWRGRRECLSQRWRIQVVLLSSVCGSSSIKNICFWKQIMFHLLMCLPGLDVFLYSFRSWVGLRRLPRGPRSAARLNVLVHYVLPHALYAGDWYAGKVTHITQRYEPK